MSLTKKIYQGLYKRSPKALQGLMTRTALFMPNKPSVKHCGIPINNRFPAKYKGALIISADFEMAWAWRFAKRRTDPEKMGVTERKNIPILIDMFENFGVPITWATVGHLLLKSCSRKSGRPHEHMKRIPYFENRVWSYLAGDWYDHDPCSDYHKAPAWYAPDLIEQILASKVPHEIGCHTFTHLDCTDERCPKDVMADEIRECVKIAKEEKIELRSMVFPGGTNGNYEVLKKYGFTNYRINAEWDLFYPEKDKNGLWRLPSSVSIENHGFGWGKEFYSQMYRIYIDKAIETGTVCHMWFHPSIDDFCLYEIFPLVLKYIKKKSVEGRLWVCTMGEMAAFCQSAHGS